MSSTPAPATSVRWIDRVRLWVSVHTSYDGLALSVLQVENDTDMVLTRLKEALALLERHDPRRYRRLKRDCRRIWITLLPGALGRYNHALKAILLDQRYVSSPATSLSEISATLVHELTHARLAGCGIGYAEPNRGRVERACYAEELAFAHRLPDSDALVARLQSYLALPDSNWSDETLRSSTVEATPSAMRYLGAPNWLIRLTLFLHRLVHKRAA